MDGLSIERFFSLEVFVTAGIVSSYMARRCRCEGHGLA
jgi:hypothetical protein